MAQIALRNASGWNVRKEILYGISHIVHHCIVCCGEFSIALGIWWSSGVQAESSPQHQYRNRAELTMCRGNSRNSHLDIFFIQNRLNQGGGTKQLMLHSHLMKKKTTRIRYRFYYIQFWSTSNWERTLFSFNSLNLPSFTPSVSISPKAALTQSKCEQRGKLWHTCDS